MHSVLKDTYFAFFYYKQNNLTIIYFFWQNTRYINYYQMWDS